MSLKHILKANTTLMDHDKMWPIPNNSNFNSSYFEDYSNEPMAMMNPKFLLLITILWSLISIIGIFANLCVIAVMLCGSKLTSATQYFIVNLAISDMLFLTICPTLALINLHGVIIYNHLPQFIGKVLCKSDYFSTHVTVFITCLTLLSMTFGKTLRY